ncbi:DNA repair protein [Thaumasiovibrio sp. DFM-14]|uniref:DNA repair protein n=1 Tax=Thaumasiovibrio sp. DFM-14 TaxID=3384792 RepID=UPI0039A1630D
MNIPLIISLVVVLLCLIIGYNIMVQYREKIESAKRQELAKHIAIIDATEDLIGNAHNFPYSKELLICLNQRIYDALIHMQEINPSDKQLGQRAANVEIQIKQLADHYTDGDTASFRVPTSDKQAIAMLQLVKRLRNVIKAEHSKGRLSTQVYVAENARLESKQLKINIENVIKRASEAKQKDQLGTAKQLLKKGLDVLSMKSDDYSATTKTKLQKMLTEIEEGQHKNQHRARQEIIDREQNDLDALFQPKKKW